MTSATASTIDPAPCNIRKNTADCTISTRELEEVMGRPEGEGGLAQRTKRVARVDLRASVALSQELSRPDDHYKLFGWSEI